MSKRYRIFILVLLTIGVVVSIISGTNMCNFGGCTEAHQYRLFGFSFPLVGIFFFGLAGTLIFFVNRFPLMDLMFSLFLAGAAGSEINMILLQKNVIQAWCPLCLGIAVIIYLLTASQLCRHLTSFKEGFLMNLKFLHKPVLMCVAALLGFTLTLSGIAKQEASAGQLNLSMGKQDSKLEVYLFSDWLCPVCIKIEGVIEAEYPLLSQKAKILFVDKIIHPDAANFVPYHLSFEANEKAKYMQLRKALFTLAQKTKNPSFDDVKAAIAPLHVSYKQLSFLEVTQQMAAFQKLAEQYKVTATPTLVIRNNKTGKVKNLVGNGEITPERIGKALKELE
jgi:protein-disulfide isomerase